MDIEKLSKKIDKYHEEDKKRANKDKCEYLSYILWGFALATTGLAITTSNPANIVAAVFFLIGGFGALWYSRRFKAD